MRTPHLILLLLILLAAFVAAYRLTPGQSEPSSMATSSPVQNPDVRLVIENFGLQLKDVSLLAPQSSVVAAMDQHYTPYVAPGLLAAWKQDPARALGRTVSSPWPERIQFAEMDVRGPKASASGTVIEVANGSGGAQIVGTYPVSFELEERGGTWLITAAERGAYSVIPARAEIVGIYTCLPHRSTTGPQTDECALGIQADSGLYYSLDTRLMESTEWQTLPTGARLRVEGVLTPASQLNSNALQKYSIEGVISATSMERL